MLLAVAACAPSRVGKPLDRTEVTMPSDDHAAVVDIVTRGMMSRGWRVRSVGQKSALFGKPAEGLPSAPENQLRVAFQDTFEGVRVNARLAGGEDIAGVDEVLELVKAKLRKGGAAAAPVPTKAAAGKASAPKGAQKENAAPPAPAEDDIVQEMKRRALSEGKLK